MIKKLLSILCLISMTIFFTSCTDEGQTEVEGVTFTNSSRLMEIGEVYELFDEVTVYPSGVEYDVVKWQSYNEDVATIDSTGRVTAVSNGAATIMLSVNGNVASTNIIVDKAGEWTLFSSVSGASTTYTMWTINEWNVSNGAVGNLTEISLDGYDSVLSIEITDAGTWAHAAFPGIEAGVYEQIKFKVRADDIDEMVYIWTGTEYTIAESVELDNDWVEVTIDFSSTADNVVLGLDGSAGDTIYFTDITLIDTDA